MSTRYSCRRGLELFAAAALSLATLLSTAVPRPAIAATDVKTLVTQAIHNTNTVNTIVHHDQTTVVSGSSHLQETASGSEDEVRNLEQDSEVVTATAKGSNGKAQTVHYTLDVIFIKGYTYYRSSLQKNQWTRRKGTTLTDPVTNGVFKRARTKVTAPQGFKLGSYSLVGTCAGLTQVIGTAPVLVWVIPMVRVPAQSPGVVGPVGLSGNAPPTWICICVGSP